MKIELIARVDGEEYALPPEGVMDILIDRCVAGTVNKGRLGDKLRSILSQHTALVKLADAVNELFIGCDEHDDPDSVTVEKKDFDGLSNAFDAWRSTLDGGKEVGK